MSGSEVIIVMRRCRGGWRRFLLLFPLIFLVFHLLSVVQLRSVNPPPNKHNKFDHLVLQSPPAGLGLPDRLHCRGIKALNKTGSMVTPSYMRLRDGVSFVTVFTVYNNAPADARASDLVTVGNASFSKTERSIAILNVFVNFIQVTMPRSNVIILTDPASDLPMQRDGVTVLPIEGEYSREKLMLQRIKSYITFLEMRLKELDENPGPIIHYIFTDSDIAVVGDLQNIFRDFHKFHLALTFRNNKDQPLNSGFIAVKGTADAILRAKNFLEEVLKVYSSKYMKASRMLGDQLALAWVVKSHPGFDLRRFTKHQAFQQDIGDTSVLFLPCAMYNWTPPEGAGQFHGLPLDVKVSVGMMNGNFMITEAEGVDDLTPLVFYAGGSFQGVEETPNARVLELL